MQGPSKPQRRSGMSFKTKRNRDAWATVRGYVYQVDLTIERWLHLQGGESLELERGEDVDLIPDLLNADDDETERRVLEQIKHRQGNLTLRSACSVEFLASAQEHRAQNPESDLSFRFVTNAEVVAERPSPFPGRRPGIQVWMDLHGADPLGSSPDIQRIRVFLQGVSRPDGLNAETWDGFTAFLSAADGPGFHEFIREVEWSYGVACASSLQSRLVSALLELRLAMDRRQATEQYQRLFLYVFKLLSTSGLKTLTTDSRAEQLALPGLSDADRGTLEGLTTLLSDVSQRVADNEIAIQGVTAQVQGLSREFSADARLTYLLKAPILTPPPPPTALTERGQLVGELVGGLAGGGWLALHGPYGVGKTTLGLLALSRLGNRAPWLSFTDMETDQAALRLDAGLAAVAGRGDALGDPLALAEEACVALGAGAVLVLDDLPRLRRNDYLAQRIELVGRAASASGVRLISTSPHPIAGVLNQDPGLVEHPVPPLSAEEVAELLLALGAPEAFLPTSPEVVAVTAISEGYPALVLAAGDFLRSTDWDCSREAFRALLQGKHMGQVREAIAEEILNTVTEEATRELLYRLNLVIGQFRQEQAMGLGNVDPALALPGERLHRLRGTWVVRGSADWLESSPLAKQLGTGNLTPEVVRAGSEFLADSALGQDRLSPSEVLTVITYLSRADRTNRMGTVLLTALQSMLDAPPTAGGMERLASLWLDQAFPADMNLALQITLRGLQVAVASRLGLRADFALGSLVTLAESADSGVGLAVTSACFLAGPGNEDTDILLANQLLVLGMRALESAAFPPGVEQDMPSFQEVVWFNTTKIHSIQGVRGWIDTFVLLGKEVVTLALQSSLAEEAQVMVSSRPWMLEHPKPPEAQDWGKVLQTLEYLRERASDLGMDYLVALCRRSEITVYAEYLKDPAQSRRVGLEALAAVEGSEDPRISFAVHEAYARQFVTHELLDEALEALPTALAFQTNALGTQRIWLLLLAARLAGENGQAALASQLIGQAVEHARNNVRVPETEIIRALGEQGLACWHSGDLPGSFQYWDEAAERLLGSGFEGETERDLYVLLGHAVGYLASLAHFGAPPTDLPGGEEYFRPPRGLMLAPWIPERQELFNAGRVHLLPSQLAMFAAGIDRGKRAAYWADLSIQMAEEAGQSHLAGSLGIAALPHLLLEKEYRKALDAGNRVAVCTVASKSLHEAGIDVLQATLDPFEYLDANEGEWPKAEDLALEVTLLPVFFQLATTSLENQAQAQQEVSLACRVLAELERLSVAGGRWAACAEALTSVFLEDVDSNELYERGRVVMNERATVAAVYYLGASLKPGCRLERSAALQLAVLKALSQTLGILPGVRRQIVSPFFLRLWRERFLASRFRFGSPAILEQAVQELDSAPVGQRVRQLFRALSFSLRARVEPDVREWLASETPEL